MSEDPSFSATFFSCTYQGSIRSTQIRQNFRKKAIRYFSVLLITKLEKLFPIWTPSEMYTLICVSGGERGEERGKGRRGPKTNFVQGPQVSRNATADEQTFQLIFCQSWAWLLCLNSGGGVLSYGAMHETLRALANDAAGPGSKHLHCCITEHNPAAVSRHCLMMTSDSW